jgi:hypothetical protein
LKYLSPEKPRIRGFWDGAGIGVLAGALGGVAIGVASGNDSPCPRGSEQYFCLSATRGEKALIFGVVLGLLGTAVGAAIGAIVGHHDQVEFTDTATSSSP